MSFGLQTYDTANNVKLTQDRKLCRLLDRTVAAAGVSGEKTIDLTNVTGPSFMAQQLDGDGYYRHVPHNITFNASTGLLTWEPCDFTNYAGFTEHAQLKHSRTLILVFGYG